MTTLAQIALLMLPVLYAVFVKDWSQSPLVNRWKNRHTASQPKATKVATVTSRPSTGKLVVKYGMKAGKVCVKPIRRKTEVGMVEETYSAADVMFMLRNTFQAGFMVGRATEAKRFASGGKAVLDQNGSEWISGVEDTEGDWFEVCRMVFGAPTANVATITAFRKQIITMTDGKLSITGAAQLEFEAKLEQLRKKSFGSVATTPVQQPAPSNRPVFGTPVQQSFVNEPPLFPEEQGLLTQAEARARGIIQ